MSTVTSLIKLNSPQEILFDAHYQNVIKTFGTVHRPKTVSSSLPQTVFLEPKLCDLQNRLKAIVFQKTDAKIVSPEVVHLTTKIADDAKAIFPYIAQYGELGKRDLLIKASVGHLLLLISALANNTLHHLVQNNKNNFTTAYIEQEDAIAAIGTDTYNLADLYCEKGIDQDAHLVHLRKQLFACQKQWAPDNMSDEELEFHIQRKNAQAKEYKNTYNGFLISNRDGCHTTILDQVCLEKLSAQISLIAAGKRPRTQFIIRIYGCVGHGLVIDVAYNPNLKRLEIICVESAAVWHQWVILNEVTRRLTGEYKILAIQSQLQKNLVGCLTFCIALSSELSKTNFSKLNQFDQVNPNELIFQDADTIRPYSPIQHVKWIPLTALGKKAITMGQSTSEMEKRLRSIFSRSEAETIVKECALYYNFVQDKQKTYYDHRRHSLSLKFQQTPFADLSLEKLLNDIKNTPSEVVSIDVALRRLAAGKKPVRQFKYLLSVLEEKGDLKLLNTRGGKEERTPLHWAIIFGKTKRAVLLLRKGAETTIPDKSELTAVDYFKTTKHAELKDNAYLQERLNKN
jgi:hypothetical protein